MENTYIYFKKLKQAIECDNDMNIKKYSKKIYNLYHKKKRLLEDDISCHKEDTFEENIEETFEENLQSLENKILTVFEKDNERDIDVNSTLFSDEEEV